MRWVHVRSAASNLSERQLMCVSRIQFHFAYKRDVVGWLVVQLLCQLFVVLD
jgi:hypothetical protein